MKVSDILKKAAAIASAAAIFSSLTAAVNADGSSDFEYGDTIIFSPYRIAWNTWEVGNEDNDTDTAFTDEEIGAKDASITTTVEDRNINLKYTEWTTSILRAHSNGSYNGGKYLYGGSMRDQRISVTIKDVPAGVYDLEQFDVSQAATSMNIYINNSDVSCGTYTAANTGDFVKVAEGLELSGDVTITYAATETKAIRLDVTKLVKQNTDTVTDAVHIEDIDADGDGIATASVWQAEATAKDGITYDEISISAKDTKGNTGTVTREGSDEKDFTTITGPGSVFVAIAVNRAKADIDSIQVTLK